MERSGTRGPPRPSPPPSPRRPATRQRPQAPGLPEPQTVADAFTSATVARLREIKRRHDPSNTIRSNFPVLA